MNCPKCQAEVKLLIHEFLVTFSCENGHHFGVDKFREFMYQELREEALAGLGITFLKEKNTTESNQGGLLNQSVKV